MPVWAEAAGAVCILVSYAIIWRVLAENSFAAPVVRIQAERGQRIVTTGPYAIVRHPMYGGAILFLLGTPLLLGSSYGLVFVPLLVVLLLAIRSVFEERALADGFSAYAAYAEKVEIPVGCPSFGRGKPFLTVLVFWICAPRFEQPLLDGLREAEAGGLRDGLMVVMASDRGPDAGGALGGEPRRCSTRSHHP